MAQKPSRGGREKAETDREERKIQIILMAWIGVVAADFRTLKPLLILKSLEKDGTQRFV